MGPASYADFPQLQGPICMKSKYSPNRVYFLSSNGDDIENTGMREAQIRQFGRPNCV